MMLIETRSKLEKAGKNPVPLITSQMEHASNSHVMNLCLQTLLLLKKIISSHLYLICKLLLIYLIIVSVEHFFLINLVTLKYNLFTLSSL
jgi:hypothetical protein